MGVRKPTGSPVAPRLSESSTLVVAVILLLIFIGFFWLNQRQTRDIEALLKQQELVADVYRVTGYGSGIHRFKNYVLRRQSSDAELARQSFTAALDTMHELRWQTTLTDEGGEAIDAFSNTIQVYLEKIDVVRNAPESVSVAALDELVRVDDTEAIRGLRVLSENLDLSVGRLRGQLRRRVTVFTLVSMLMILGLVFNIHQHRSALLAGGEQLRKRNQELEHFAYRASHDLKAPLTSIQGLARVIEEDVKLGDLDEVNLNTQRIIALCRKLSGVISNVLALTRSGLDVESPEPVELDTVFADICEGLKWMLDEKGVTLSTQFDVARVVVEPFRLRQVFENLLSNAIKYSSDEDGQIRVSSHTVGGNTELRVWDNGDGIAPEHYDEVFDMFSRFSVSRFGGSGLGLYIAKTHLDAMGARISVESSSTGTTFSVRFPQ